MVMNAFPSTDNIVTHNGSAEEKRKIPGDIMWAM